MSHIYANEPVTTGKAIIKTTHGEIEVELWCKECPLACRNFLQLSLENHYAATEFQVLERKRDLFLLFGPSDEFSEEGRQTIYDGGRGFKDEPHTRIGFTRRGLLVMAKDDGENRTRFYITLSDSATSAAFEAHFGAASAASSGSAASATSYTIFGKVVGPTIYNVLKMGLNAEEEERERELLTSLREDQRRLLESETSELTERVLVQGVDVITPYWENLKPRYVKQKPEVVQQPEKSAKDRLKEAAREKLQRVKATNNSNLLSFDAPDEEEDEGIQVRFRSSNDRKRKKTDARVTSSSSSSKYDDEESEDEINKNKISKKSTSAASPSPEEISVTLNIESLLESEEKKKREARLQETEAEFLAIRQKLTGAKTSDAKPEAQKFLSPLEQRRAKYMTKPKTQSKEARSDETFSKFLSFSSSLGEKMDRSEREAVTYHGQVLETGDAPQDLSDWLSGSLRFKKHIDDSYRTKDDDYLMVEVAQDRTRAHFSSSSHRDRQRGEERRGRSRDRR